MLSLNHENPSLVEYSRTNVSVNSMAFDAMREIDFLFELDSNSKAILGSQNPIALYDNTLT